MCKNGSRKIINKITNFLFSHSELICLLFFSQFIIYLILPDHLIPYQINITGGDAPSYRYFDFSNLNEILSSHRTFGLPLIIRFYEMFSETLYLWPQVNFIFFSLSCLFFLYSLLKTDFNKLFSFFFVIGLFGSYNLYFFFKGWTELFSVSFIIFATSFFLLSLKYKKIYLYILTTFLLFYTYQIRPSFVVYIFFFPSYIFFKNLLDKINFKIVLLNLIRISLLSILPFIIFIFLRMLITDHIGITPFAGVNIAGHATHYMEEKDIYSLSTKHEKFAKGVIDRKRKHVYPCNLFLNEIKELKLNPRKIKKQCFNIYVMSGWLEMIKQIKKLEPFPKNDPRNFNSWDHVETLGIFFTKTGNNNIIDRELSNYAWIIILKDHKKEYFTWFIISFYESLILLFYSLKNLLFFYIFVIIFFYLGKKLKFNDAKILPKINNVKALIFSILLIQFLSLILTSLTNIPYIRALSAQSIFLVPSLFAFIILYFFYDKTKKI